MLYLDSEQGRQYLLEEYVQKEKSIELIAEELGSNYSKVRRALLKWKIPIRSRADAQRIALESGRSEHPTEGSKRPTKTVERISQGVAAAWERLDKHKRDQRVSLAKANWEKLSEEEKRELHRLANEGIRKASKEGSTLERGLLAGLSQCGYKLKPHLDVQIQGFGRMHLDLLVEGPLDIIRVPVVVEIDGPSHFLPIWGVEKLEKTIKADQRKNGMLLSLGYRVIRLRQESSNYSLSLLYKALALVKEALVSTERFIELSV